MDHEKTFLMKPKVDFCFKELMEDPEVRRGFISALLGVKPEEIEETKLLPTYLRREHEEDKLGILDIRVFILDPVKGKSQMDLEIQLAPFSLWPERSLFYLAKMYAGEIKKGQSYGVLQKCIHVGILDFVLFGEDEEFYSCFHLWEDHRQRIYTEKLEIHILELPKLAERDYPETELLNWARFFNGEQKEEFEMAAEGSPYIERAYERLTDISADEVKRLEYEAREKAILDHMYLMEYHMDLGLKRGREEALEQGAKALIEICREASRSREETFSSLVQKLSLTRETAEEYLEKYWISETMSAGAHN